MYAFVFISFILLLYTATSFIALQCMYVDVYVHVYMNICMDACIFICIMYYIYVLYIMYMYVYVYVYMYRYTLLFSTSPGPVRDVPDSVVNLRASM